MNETGYPHHTYIDCRHGWQNLHICVRSSIAKCVHRYCGNPRTVICLQMTSCFASTCHSNVVGIWWTSHMAVLQEYYSTFFLTMSVCWLNTLVVDLEATNTCPNPSSFWLELGISRWCSYDTSTLTMSGTRAPRVQPTYAREQTTEIRILKLVCLRSN